jgi:hypoxanthine phosphoribosyltransferase
MPSILHIDPDEFLIDSFRLGKKLYETGFRPKHAISIWRGGTPVGLGVDAYFRSQGLRINHTTIATESYTGIAQRGSVAIKGLEHVIKVVCPEDGLLIIDDVYESGRTIESIVTTLRERARANAPKEIVVGTVHSKPESHEYVGSPIVSLRDLPGNVWIDYPHELADLVNDEDPDDGALREKDEEIWNIIRSDHFEPTEEHHPGPYRYVSARHLLLEALRLGVNIAADQDFFPDFLIALWPGGISAGLPVHEVYKYKLKKRGANHAPPDHISLNTTETFLSYRSNIIGIRYLEERINRHDNVLIIDTTFRSGRLFSDVLVKLKEALRRNLTHDRVRMASIFFNPEDRSTWTVRPLLDRPHYYLRQVDHDIIYPQSVHKLGNPKQELPQLAPELAHVLYE